MSMLDSLRTVVTHPATLASTVTSAIGTVLFVPPDVLVVTLWQSLGTLFGTVSILGFTVGDTIDWIPAGSLQAAAVVLGLLLVVKKLGTVYERIQENSET